MGETVTYNNISQMQYQLSLQLGVRTSAETALVAYGGYTIAGSLRMHHESEYLRSSKGRNEGFAGIQFHHFRLL